jgi:hypothetical protein
MAADLNQPRTVDGVVLGASASALAGGIAAVVLALIGLAHYAPHLMAAISAIVLGGAFALNGGMLAGESPRMAGLTNHVEAFQFGGGVSAEGLAGIAAVVLGILALLEIDAPTLIPVATIVLGAGTIFGTGAVARFDDGRRTGSLSDGLIHGALAFSMALQILAGVGAIVLGILGLLDYDPMVLSLVAFAALGATALLSGASVTSRVLNPSAS